MINVIFPDGIDAVKVKAVDQWDYNRSLVISGMEKSSGAQQVHFYNKFSKEAVRRIAYVVGDNYEVTIPNSLLREEYDITAAVYMNTYNAAPYVSNQTQGTYYTKVWNATAKFYRYIPHVLPNEYVEGTAYYKRVGETLKKVIIPVIPRAKPCDCVDMEDPTDEDIITELMNYCEALNEKVDAATVEALKERIVVVSKEEYNTLVAEGKAEDDVLYCIEDSDLYEEFKEGIISGDIPITNVGNADKVNGISLKTASTLDNTGASVEALVAEKNGVPLPIIPNYSRTALSALNDGIGRQINTTYAELSKLENGDLTPAKALTADKASALKLGEALMFEITGIETNVSVANFKNGAIYLVLLGRASGKLSTGIMKYSLGDKCFCSLGDYILMLNGGSISFLLTEASDGIYPNGAAIYFYELGA